MIKSERACQAWVSKKLFWRIGHFLNIACGTKPVMTTIDNTLNRRKSLFSAETVRLTVNNDNDNDNDNGDNNNDNNDNDDNVVKGSRAWTERKRKVARNKVDWKIDQTSVLWNAEKAAVSRQPTKSRFYLEQCYEICSAFLSVPRSNLLLNHIPKENWIPKLNTWVTLKSKPLSGAKLLSII